MSFYVGKIHVSSDSRLFMYVDGYMSGKILYLTKVGETWGRVH